MAVLLTRLGLVRVLLANLANFQGTVHLPAKEVTVTGLVSRGSRERI